MGITRNVETAESWMRAIGVIPQCNFITEKLYG